MRTSRLAVIATSAVVAATGCGVSASSDGHPSTVLSTVGTGTNVRHPLTPEQVAGALVAGARVPRAAVELHASPIASMRTPPSLPEETGRIERMRWWRIEEPMEDVYAAVAHDQGPSLRYDGSETSDGPALRDASSGADFELRDVPPTVNSAEFTIAVAPLTTHSSEIAAYAVVVGQPPRPDTEDVPLVIDSVRVAKTVGPAVVYASPEPTTPPPVTATGLPAQQLVREFDALRVRPSGEMSCPMPSSTTSATFRYNDHTMVATDGSCGGVDVTLDGRELGSLQPSVAFTHDLAAVLAHRPIAAYRHEPNR